MRAVSRSGRAGRGLPALAGWVSKEGANRSLCLAKVYRCEKDICQTYARRMDWLAASLNGSVGVEIQFSCLGMDRAGLPRLLAAGEGAAAAGVSQDRSLGETPPHHSIAAPGCLPERRSLGRMKACGHPLKSGYETLTLHRTALLSPRSVSRCWPQQHGVRGKKSRDQQPSTSFSGFVRA